MAASIKNDGDNMAAYGKSGDASSSMAASVKSDGDNMAAYGKSGDASNSITVFVDDEDDDDDDDDDTTEYGESDDDASSRMDEETVRRMHKKWMAEYGRTYADAEEEERRFRIFQSSVEEIEKLNASEWEVYLLELSPYSDHTDAEFFALLGGLTDHMPEDMQDDVTFRTGRMSEEDWTGSGKRRWLLKQEKMGAFGREGRCRVIRK